MVIGIIGESCTGKSTIAQHLKSLLGAEVYTRKDYLRLAKNETVAEMLFQKKLEDAASGTHIIYVISEQGHLKFLPEQAIRVLVTADLETIKERFARRVNGNLPAPVAAMLAKKHGCFDAERCDIHVVSEKDDVNKICSAICDQIATM